MMDAQDRCCNRKPIRYAPRGGNHFYCPRCDRAYDLKTRQQIANWAWKPIDGQFVATYPKATTKMPGR